MSKFFDDLKKLGEILSHLRTIGLIVLFSVLVISVTRNGCDRKELKHLFESTTGLNYENDILHNHINERDSMIVEKEKIIEDLEAAIVRSETSVSKLVDHYTRLFTRYESLADSITRIPGDSSYSYLNETAYPLPGIKKFPFSEKQVNAMHLTYVEHGSLSSMHDALKQRISLMNTQQLLRDSIITERTTQVDSLQKTQLDYEHIVMNQTEQVDLLTTHIKEEKKRNRFWKIAGGVVIAILAAIAAFGG